MVKREKALATQTKGKVHVQEEEEKDSLSDNNGEENDQIMVDVGAPVHINKSKSRTSKLEKNIETMDIIDKNTGVIYVGHLPWGFEDSGIRKYFVQFGNILRILVPRSKKSGRTKGFAFVEFEDREVAEIASKTMNNYILFDRVLKCAVVEDTSKYNVIFMKCKRKFKFFDKYQNYVQQKNKLKTHDETKKHITQLLEKEEVKRKKLAEMGIKFDFPGFADIVNKHKKAHPESNKKQPKVAEKKVESVADKKAEAVPEKKAAVVPEKKKKLKRHLKKQKIPKKAKKIKINLFI